jgi:hypothetical protein
MFEKDYWFHHQVKGYFITRVTLLDVLLEFKSNEFVSVKDLFPTRKGFMEARTDKVRDLIMKAHLKEYEEMMMKLKSFTMIEQQDDYIVKEMIKEGYAFTPNLDAI